MRISKQRALGVLAFAVCTAAPARAAEFSPERALGASAENERVLWKNSSRVAFDGESYVALWQADRANFAPFYGGWLYAARVSEDGTLLDAHGILVARNASLGSSAVDPRALGHSRRLLERRRHRCSAAQSFRQARRHEPARRRTRASPGIRTRRPLASKTDVSCSTAQTTPRKVLLSTVAASRFRGRRSRSRKACGPCE